MANYTLSYNKIGVDGSGGWPSFYSFYPEWMIGMNNYFYSFKTANLFRHNVSTKRNTFYDFYTPSRLTSVLNEGVIENKLYKTLTIEGTDPWITLLQSDQQTGKIEETWYDKKEGAWFAFIRNYNTPNFSLRSVNGIGECTNVSVLSDLVTVQFAENIDIGTIISIGDFLYYGDDQPVKGGKIVTIDTELNQIVYDYVIEGGSVLPPNSFTMYVKNGIAESHGVLGHYCKFTLTNQQDTAVELYLIKSEVMKSFP